MTFIAQLQNKHRWIGITLFMALLRSQCISAYHRDENHRFIELTLRSKNQCQNPKKQTQVLVQETSL